MRTNSLSLAFVAAGTLLLAAASAGAQDYGNYRDDQNVEIRTPHYGPERDKTGIPYTRASLSQNVYFDDLNLRTDRGAHILKTRVRLTARLLCRELDDRYPVTAPNSPPCYRTALEDAMYQADRAIDGARSYSD